MTWLLLTLLGTLLGSLIIGECHAFAEWLVRRAARRLPEDGRDRWEEEWLETVERLLTDRSEVRAIWFAIGVLVHAGRVARVQEGAAPNRALEDDEDRPESKQAAASLVREIAHPIPLRENATTARAAPVRQYDPYPDVSTERLKEYLSAMGHAYMKAVDRRDEYAARQKWKKVARALDARAHDQSLEKTSSKLSCEDSRSPDETSS